MHRILADGVTLRFQVKKQSVDTHARGRISQAVPHSPAQCADLRNCIAFHDIAKQHGIDIAL
jgi:hypothetical protein